MLFVSKYISLSTVLVPRSAIIFGSKPFLEGYLNFLIRRGRRFCVIM